MIHWVELRRDERQRWGLVYSSWPDTTRTITVSKVKSWGDDQWHAATVNWSVCGEQSPEVAEAYGRALVRAARQARKYDEEQTP